MLRGTANRFFPELCVKTFTATTAYYMVFIASQVLKKKRYEEVLVYRHYIGLHQKKLCHT